MNQGLVIFMLLGIAGGIVGAVTALILGWGWLLAILIYCLTGSVILVGGVSVAVVLTVRPARYTSDPGREAATDSNLVQVLR